MTFHHQVSANRSDKTPNVCNFVVSCFASIFTRQTPTPMHIQRVQEWLTLASPTNLLAASSARNGLRRSLVVHSTDSFLSWCCCQCEIDAWCGQSKALTMRDRWWRAAHSHTRRAHRADARINIYCPPRIDAIHPSADRVDSDDHSHSSWPDITPLMLWSATGCQPHTGCHNTLMQTLKPPSLPPTNSSSSKSSP